MKFYKLIFIDLIVVFSLIFIANIFKYNLKINKYYITYPNLHYYFDNYINKKKFISLFGNAEEYEKLNINSDSTRYHIFISLQKRNEKKLLNQFFYDEKLSLFENNNQKSIINIYSINEINEDELKKKTFNEIIKIINKMKILTNSKDLYNYYLFKNILNIERADIKYLDEKNLRLQNIDLGYDIPLRCNLTDKEKSLCWIQQVKIELVKNILVINLIKIFSLTIFFIYVFLRVLFDLKKRKK